MNLYRPSPPRSWRVHLGSHIIRNSRTGLVRKGSIEIGDDGRLNITGWKLWDSRIRAITAILLIGFALWANFKTFGFLADAARDPGWFKSSVEGVESFMKQLSPFPRILLGVAIIALLHTPFIFISCVITPALLGYMARRGTVNLIPTSGANVSGQKVSISLRHPEDSDSRPCRLYFQNQQDATEFASNISAVPDTPIPCDEENLTCSGEWPVNLKCLESNTGLIGKAQLALVGGKIELTGQKLSSSWRRVIMATPVTIICLMIGKPLSLLLPVVLVLILLYRTPVRTTFSIESKPRRTMQKINVTLRPDGHPKSRPCRLYFHTTGDAKEFITRIHP